MRNGRKGGEQTIQTRFRCSNLGRVFGGSDNYRARWQWWQFASWYVVRRSPASVVSALCSVL